MGAKFELRKRGGANTYCWGRKSERESQGAGEKGGEDCKCALHDECGGCGIRNEYDVEGD